MLAQSHPFFSCIEAQRTACGGTGTPSNVHIHVLCFVYAKCMHMSMVYELLSVSTIEGLYEGFAVDDVLSSLLHSSSSMSCGIARKDTAARMWDTYCGWRKSCTA